MSSSHLTPYLPYGFLGAAIVSIWLPGRASRAWLPLLGISLVTAIVSKDITVAGLGFLALFTCCLYVTERWPPTARKTGRPQSVSVIRGVAFAGAVVLAVGIGIGAVPGFGRLVIYRDVVLSPGAFPYTLSLNYGIALIGLLIIGLGRHTAPTGKQWPTLFRQMIPYSVVTIIVVIVTAILIGYTRLAPKWPPALGLWLATNLLFTCIAEEAFFRGFIQHHLADWLNKAGGGTVAWLVASVAFGVAHAAGGGGYVFLATIAGLGYGLVYIKTTRLEASILTHFALDTVHILFFVYPRLVA